MAIGLIYTHWSLRQLTTPLPSHQELFDLLMVKEGPTSISYITTASLQDKIRNEIIYPSFVLQWADGRRFVIDMGMDEQGSQDFFNKMGWQYDSDSIQSHGSIKEQLGADYSSVAGLGLTHLHPDHVQGAQTFCRAESPKVPLFQTAQQASERNHTTVLGAALVDQGSCIEPRTLTSDSYLKPIPDFPGLAAFPIAGHSPGSSIFVAAVEGKLWVIAGDVSWERNALLSNQPKKVSLFRSILIPEDDNRLLELRQWLAQLDTIKNVGVLLCHDSHALKQFGPPTYHSINGSLNSNGT